MAWHAVFAIWDAIINFFLQVKTGPKGIPYLYTTDGRTIRYPDPVVKVLIRKLPLLRF